MNASSCGTFLGGLFNTGLEALEARTAQAVKEISVRRGRSILHSNPTPGSAAIDTDIDEDARTLDDGYDIGADEFFAGQLRVYLPLIVRKKQSGKEPTRP